MLLSCRRVRHRRGRPRLLTDKRTAGLDPVGRYLGFDGCRPTCPASRIHRRGARVAHAPRHGEPGLLRRGLRLGFREGGPGRCEEYQDDPAIPPTAARSLGWTDLAKAFSQVFERAGRSTCIVYVGDGIPTVGNADPAASPPSSAASTTRNAATRSRSAMRSPWAARSSRAS